MKVITVPILIALLLLACTRADIPSVKVVSPKRLLPRDSFVVFMSDIHLTETYLAEFGRQQGSNSAQESRKLYDLLFKKYKLSPAEARENMVFYSSDAKGVESLYKEILQKLHDCQLGLDSTKVRSGK